VSEGKYRKFGFQTDAALGFFGKKWFYRMRFAKLLRFLFLFSLTLSVFGGELGESCRLADDVSNDFVRVSATPIYKVAEVAPRRLTSQRSIAITEELVPYLAISPFAKPARSSASDLLHLVSIQRK